MDWIAMLLLLIGMHFVCDYPLQSDAIAVGKGKFADPHLGVPWYYWMTAHAATHGVAVGVITQNKWLGLYEFAIHFAIDRLKCRGCTNIHTDQAFHILCKILYVGFVFSKGLTP